MVNHVNNNEVKHQVESMLGVNCVTEPLTNWSTTTICWLTTNLDASYATTVTVFATDGRFSVTVDQRFVDQKSRVSSRVTGWSPGGNRALEVLVGL